MRHALAPSYPHFGSGAFQSIKNVHSTWTSFMGIVSTTIFIVLKRHFCKHKCSFKWEQSCGMQIFLDSAGQYRELNASPVRNVLRLCFSYLPVKCHKNISTWHPGDKQQCSSTELRPASTQREAFFQFLSKYVQRQREPLWVTSFATRDHFSNQTRGSR